MSCCGSKIQTISPKGIELIQSFEGFSSKAYDDGVGVWTIGWGTTKYENGVRVKRGDSITVQRALELFMHDLSGFEKAVRSHDVSKEVDVSDIFCRT